MGTAASQSDTAMELHATTVALGDRGLLITGPSGSGKSQLALMLMALGCALVADDRTSLQARGDHLIAACPPALSGLIEARGIGLLHADPAGPVPLVLALALDQPEPDRLPQRHRVHYLGRSLPLLRTPEGGHLAAAVLQMLHAGRATP